MNDGLCISGAFEPMRAGLLLWQRVFYAISDITVSMTPVGTINVVNSESKISDDIERRVCL